jgi:hypothetical protein
MMQLYPNWKEIARRSWSLRFIILAGILSGLEVILPFFSDEIPRNFFAALSFMAVSAAFVARLVAQKGI